MTTQGQQKQQQAASPKRELGFFAMVPRLVRTHPKYKNLSHAEKWLYTCLKDLCGDSGTCFRTLLALSRETDFSTGALSQMIRRLHDIGLIHAEKKRRGDVGHELWHISIVDVWQANAKHCSGNEPFGMPPPDHDPQRSENETNRSIDEQNAEELAASVQSMNNVVQFVNDKLPGRSQHEAKRSGIGDRRRIREAEPPLKKNREEDTASGSDAKSMTLTGWKTHEEDGDLWTVEAILNLAAQHLPPLPTHISEKQRHANAINWQEAAVRLHDDSYFRLIGAEAAISHLDRMLQYVSHAHSPSWWMVEFTCHQHKQVRLWHVANNCELIGLAMEKDQWYPPISPLSPGNDGDCSGGNEVEAFVPTPLVSDHHEGEAEPVSVQPGLPSLSEEDYAILVAQIEEDVSNYPEIEHFEVRSDGVLEVFWCAAWSRSRYCSEIRELAHWPMLLAEIQSRRLSSWRERWEPQRQQRKAG
jgi:hypothetical protein